MDNSMRTIALRTPSAKYDVVIGAGVLRSLAAAIIKLTGKKPARIFVITSPEIWALWSNAFLASFIKARVEVVTLVIPSGEARKRMRTIERVTDELADEGADRDSLLIAFGGGVVGDITGFVAAIYMRGVRYVQVPTTLLAQVDSSIGGKTGVNLAHGKNLVGSFYHPLGVFADIDLLATLPPRELRAGLQESVKAGVIRDAHLFAYMEKNASAILRGDAKALEHVVTASVKMKADVVSRDEKESGLRMILNYGHTIGHAIEAATGYKALLHGEAIAWGMIAALHIALQRGLVTEKESARITQLILRYGPPPAFHSNVLQLMNLTVGDKKNRGGVRKFILPTGIGSTQTVTDVTNSEMMRGIEAMFSVKKHCAGNRK